MKYVLWLGIPVAVVLAYASRGHYWVGSRSLDVEVLILEASTLKPITDAQIEILEGPPSHHDCSTLNLERDFQATDSAKQVSDRSGRTQFQHRFFAYGSRSWLHNSGRVRTNRLWLRVTAEGYRTPSMPVDRQSILPRDIEDDTPILVTVPVGKIAADN